MNYLFSSAKSLSILRYKSFLVLSNKFFHQMMSNRFHFTNFNQVCLHRRISLKYHPIFHSCQQYKSNLSKNNEKCSNWRVKGALSLDDIYQHLLQENAQDIAVIELDAKAQYVRYLVVVTANSMRHLEYMSSSLNILYKRMKSKEQPFSKIEGKRHNNGWICLDLGNAVVHFMLSEYREKYELEKLWLLGSKFDDQIMMKKIVANDTYNFEDELFDSSFGGVNFLESDHQKTIEDETQSTNDFNADDYMI